MAKINKFQLKMQEPFFLTTAPKHINGSVTYVCPRCGNGSGTSGTGIVLVPRTENGKRWKCFVCGLCEDFIGLYMISYGVGFREAINKLSEHFEPGR